MVSVDGPNDVSERGPTAPMRSVRRGTARRASSRRAFGSSRMSDSDAIIIDFLAHHPSSTTGDLAKSLNLDPGHIAARLTRLTATGEIHRAPHGYGT
jgi:DNA-binding MarR family transcriptional regulator